MRRFLSGLLLFFFMTELAYSHGGRLNSSGCHNNRKTGEYHCHRSGYTPSAPSARAASSLNRQPPAETSALAKTVERQEAKIKKLESEIAALKAETAACRASRR